LIPTEPTDRVLIITGINRWLFTLVCFTLCLALYNLKIELPRLFHKVGIFFAEISYCLYLVHGLCFMYSQKILNSTLENYPERIRFLFAVALTISYLSYVSLEKYFIGQGKKLINKVNGKFKALH
jgi:peptidoglycan/LPS O-acetylase OafA/YrhL